MHPPPYLARLTTPESGHCHSVCTLCGVEYCTCFLKRREYNPLRYCKKTFAWAAAFVDKETNSNPTDGNQRCACSYSELFITGASFGSKMINLNKDYFLHTVV
jgi:hypothetical protein